MPEALLIPPCGGSNPPAPASQGGPLKLSNALAHGLRASCQPLGGRQCGIGVGPVLTTRDVLGRVPVLIYDLAPRLRVFCNSSQEPRTMEKSICDNLIV
jgi:hypothetical protein